MCTNVLSLVYWKSEGVTLNFTFPKNVRDRINKENNDILGKKGKEVGICIILDI